MLIGSVTGVHRFREVQGELAAAASANDTVVHQTLAQQTLAVSGTKYFGALPRSVRRPVDVRVGTASGGVKI